MAISRTGVRMGSAGSRNQSEWRLVGAVWATFERARTTSTTILCMLVQRVEEPEWRRIVLSDHRASWTEEEHCSEKG